MKERLKYVLLLALLCTTQYLLAQAGGDIVRGTVTSQAEGPLMQVSVVEMDNTDRIISATVTDMNGEFSLKIKSPKNFLRFNYVGYITQKLLIGDTRVFEIDMKEDHVLDEVVVKGRKTKSAGGLDIPEREVSMAMQTISTKEFEGLSVASIDDALQGRIAGLDIVGVSGDLGGGMNMRLRGVSSLSGNTQPLIVVDGIIFSATVSSDFDFATATEDQYAELLQISPDDIDQINVLKDASATAIWGSQGANGVLQFTTKKGARGKTKVQYTYRYSGAWQPSGYKLLDGDEYTMFMKEALFNANSSDASADKTPLNYDQNYENYNEFNDNTDWVDLVTQYGQTHDHYITVTGGGEKARFRVSGGYYTQTGTVIKQELDRYSSRMNLDYFVSKRIKFSTEFSFTFTDQKKNYDNLLNIAYQKMPNASVYQEDANGNDTGQYFAYGAAADKSALDLGAQDGMVNPVASANLAKKNSQDYRIIPTFRLQYDLLDPDEGATLRLQGLISFDVANNSADEYYPKALTDLLWSDQDIKATYYESKSMGITNKEELTYAPKFSNKDHSLLFYAAYEIRWGDYSGQTIASNRLPVGMESASAGTYLSNLSSGPSDWRRMALTANAHYSYQSKYSIDATLRRDGSTKFGKSNKWGNFPGVSVRWNVSDENWMKWSNKWLTMFSLRPSWGISGKEPDSEYLHYSKYSSNSGYINTAGLEPSNIRLTSLKWEKSEQWNAGTDFEFWNGKLSGDFNYYYKKTTDLLSSFAIPTSSGFSSYDQKNSGRIDNEGWELNLNTNNLLKFGDFTVDFNFNIANNINTIKEMETSVLDSYNNEFDYNNGTYLQRVQVGNSFGSIYGFKYKGVYQYNYYSDKNPNGKNGTQTYEGEPVARNANGDVIFDESGKPKQMYYHYGDANQWAFQGGDAIYQDINNDGNIDALDIVYLGNSNPDFNGGFGVKFKYKRLTLNIFSNFRYGNSIVNLARLNLESMRESYNQCASINWRWRKEGDVTEMPRALYGVGYNSLGSDRYVEDGSFWRIKYITLNYGVDSKLLKKYYLTQLNFYLTMNNLWCFTKYTGVDPEVGYSSTGIATDSGKTPRSQYFTVGVSVGF